MRKIICVLGGAGAYYSIQRQLFSGGVMKRVIMSALLILPIGIDAFAADPARRQEKVAAGDEQVSEPEEITFKSKETWQGRIEKIDGAGIPLFASGGRHYRITGTLEQDLLKEVGKEIKLTGVISEDGRSIQALKAEPVIAVK